MSNNTDIFTAFAAKVATYAASKSLPVAWPGVSFTPPTTTNAAWLEVAWFPNQTVDNGLTGDFSQLRGFGQVSCCARPGAGVVGVLATADDIVALFPKMTALGAGYVSHPPWISTVLQGTDRVSAPVTVRYESNLSY